jgi:hypothetical protein
MAASDMQVSVSAGTGKTLTLEVEGGESIAPVKRKIEQSERMPPVRQRLFFNEIPLEMSRTGRACNTVANLTRKAGWWCSSLARSL